MTQPAFGPAPASPARAIPLVAQFTRGELRWGDLRAIVAMAADADDDIVNFEVSHFDDNIITGIYLGVAWPR